MEFVKNAETKKINTVMMKFMDREKVIQAYFRGLEKGSYNDVITLFSSDAIIHSPLYGNVQATQFYKELFSDTQNSKIILKNSFISPHNPDCIAAHFLYSWTMKDGALVQFECVDVFECVPNSDKIQSLTIIYDTYNTTRPEFEKICIKPSEAR